MTSIDRRDLLSAVAATTLLPAWLRRAFRTQDGAGQDTGERRVQAVRQGWRKALARGKPLLVVVVPERQDQWWERGQVLGATFNHGGRDVLLDLATCELAAAGVAEVAKALRCTVRGGLDEPVLLLVEPRAGADATPVVRPVAVDLSVPPEIAEGEAEDGDPRAGGRTDRVLRLRAERVAAAMHRAVAPDAGTVGLRADAVRATLTGAERGELEGLFAGRSEATAALLVRAAAVVRMQAEAPRRDGEREQLLSQLEGAARTVCLQQPVPGADWARSSGCGVDVEGTPEDERARIACGMGFVPEIGQRLLYFYERS